VTRFELASVTKTFTAALLGLISTCVAQSLNNFSSGYWLTPMGQQITFEELATFSAGFPDDTHNNPVNPPTQENFVAYVNGLSPAVLPAPYAYSNDSFGFLGQVLMGQAGASQSPSGRSALYSVGLDHQGRIRARQRSAPS
jgi:CubicO group peptidase (beta-lactamase class C family)